MTSKKENKNFYCKKCLSNIDKESSIEKNLKNKNIIFRNLIKRIISENSPLNSRYKFLNSIEICNIILNSFKNNVRLKNIFTLLNFSIHFIKKDVILKSNEKEKIINLLKNFEKILKSNEYNISDKQIKTFKDKLNNFILEIKKDYIELGFKYLKTIYNNWELNPNDFEKIENAIYVFISTRLTWGFSWKEISTTLYNVIKKININLYEEDLIKWLLKLKIKFDPNVYNVFIPLVENETLKNKYFKKHFENKKNDIHLTNSDLFLKNLEEKNEKNLEKINFKTDFLAFKISSKDPYSALEEVIYRKIPQVIGPTYIWNERIEIDKEKNILITSEWKNKQFFLDSKYEEILKKTLFKKDFHIVPEIKYENILNNLKSNHSIQKYLKEIIKFKHIYLEKKWIEEKAPIISIIHEKLLKIFKVIDFQININEKITNLSLIDIYIENYVNNAFEINRENFLNKIKNNSKKNLNDIEYFKFYLKNKKVYYDEKCNSIECKHNKWTHQNEIIKEKNEQLIKISINWFINRAIQIRHAYMHQGLKLNFFDRLTIETTETIMSLVITKILNKKIFNKEEFVEILKIFKEWKKTKDFKKLIKIL